MSTRSWSRVTRSGRSIASFRPRVYRVTMEESACATMWAAPPNKKACDWSDPCVVSFRVRRSEVRFQYINSGLLEGNSHRTPPPPLKRNLGITCKPATPHASPSQGRGGGGAYKTMAGGSNIYMNFSNFEVNSADF